MTRASGMRVPSFNNHREVSMLRVLFKGKKKQSRRWTRYFRRFITVFECRRQKVGMNTGMTWESTQKPHLQRGAGTQPRLAHKRLDQRPARHPRPTFICFATPDTRQPQGAFLSQKCLSVASLTVVLFLVLNDSGTDIPSLIRD